MNFLTILFFIFLFLKLAGFGLVADWSWWWVTSPLWFLPVLLFAIPTIIFVGGFIFCTLLKILNR